MNKPPDDRRILEIITRPAGWVGPAIWKPFRYKSGNYLLVFRGNVEETNGFVTGVVDGHYSTSLGQNCYEIKLDNCPYVAHCPVLEDHVVVSFEV